MSWVNYSEIIKSWNAKFSKILLKQAKDHLKTPERCRLRSDIFIVISKQISHIVLLFQLLHFEHVNCRCVDIHSSNYGSTL